MLYALVQQIYEYFISKSAQRLTLTISTITSANDIARNTLLTNHSPTCDSSANDIAAPEVIESFRLAIVVGVPTGVHGNSPSG